MALMASNIYILEYLKNTQQLTPAILEKTIDFLTKGKNMDVAYVLQLLTRFLSKNACVNGETWSTSMNVPLTTRIVMQLVQSLHKEIPQYTQRTSLFGFSFLHWPCFSTPVACAC